MPEREHLSPARRVAEFTTYPISKLAHQLIEQSFAMRSNLTQKPPPAHTGGMPLHRVSKIIGFIGPILSVWFSLTVVGKGETEYKSSTDVVGLPVSMDKEIQGETEGFASLLHTVPRDNHFQQQIAVGKETNPVYWRINLQDTKAEVTSAGGAEKEVMTTEFSVLSKKYSQLILMRTTDNCVETIIINPQTGTLVYTRNQMLNIIGSDAAISWGTCHN